MSIYDSLILLQGGAAPGLMSAYAQTEWTSTGIVASQYCPVPHGLSVRPDYIQICVAESLGGIDYYDAFVWDLYNIGWIANGSSAAIGSYMRHRTNGSWTHTGNIFQSSSYHPFANNTDFYIYHSSLTSYLPNGRKYIIRAYRLNIPSEWRGPYEYTSDPTVT